MNLLKYLPLVAKAIMGVNVKDEMESRDDVIDRPFWMSGRFIGFIMTALFGSYAAKVGMDLNASIENVTELVNLIFDNKELFVSVGLMIAGMGRFVLGLIQRKIG